MNAELKTAERYSVDKLGNQIDETRIDLELEPFGYVTSADAGREFAKNPLARFVYVLHNGMIVACFQRSHFDGKVIR